MSRFPWSFCGPVHDQANLFSPLCRTDSPLVSTGKSLAGRKTQLNNSSPSKALRNADDIGLGNVFLISSFASSRQADTMGERRVLAGAAERGGQPMVPSSWGEPAPILKEMIARGHLGKKAGKGFYKVASGFPKGICAGGLKLILGDVVPGEEPMRGIEF